jgi:hypothetical protein
MQRKAAICGDLPTQGFALIITFRGLVRECLHQLVQRRLGVRIGVQSSP